jgi:hypothetical protein
MNKTHSIHLYIKKAIDKQPILDGRILVALALILYFSILYLANFFIPYTKIWKSLGIPTMPPLFADLRIVLSGFECTRLGYDVLYDLPCNPYQNGQTSLPYPRLWMKLEWLGLNQSHTFFLGILMAISFYLVTLAFIGKLNRYEAIIYSLILCSPPIMLLIERANVDIIIYVLLFLSLLIVQRHSLLMRCVGYITLLLPTALKLTPVFSLIILIKEKKRDFLLYFTSIITVAIVYLYSIRDEIKAIKSTLNYQTLWHSFGAKLLMSQVRRLISLKGFRTSSNIFHSLVLIVLIFLSIIVSVKLLLFVYKEFKQWLNSELPPKNNAIESDQSLDLFRLGSSLYLGTFLTAVNFDYKLSFLVFTIPQILFWIKYDNKKGIISSFALLGILSSLYLSAFFYEWLVDEIINWFLWGYYLYAFILTLPQWIKIQIHHFFAPRIARV